MAKKRRRSRPDRKLPAEEATKRIRQFEKGFLWCTGHKQFFPIRKFSKNRVVGHYTNFGYSYRCKDCTKAYYRKNQEKRKRQMRSRLRRLTAKYVRLAGGRCQKCGYDKYLSAMSFHHVNPENKSHNPTVVIRSGDHKKVERELDKCILLCMSCHFGFEGGEWVGTFVKLEGLGWTVEAAEDMADNLDWRKDQ
jgi:hypothetical protein